MDADPANRIHQQQQQHEQHQHQHQQHQQNQHQQHQQQPQHHYQPQHHQPQFQLHRGGAADDGAADPCADDGALSDSASEPEESDPDHQTPSTTREVDTPQPSGSVAGFGPAYHHQQQQPAGAGAGASLAGQHGSHVITAQDVAAAAAEAKKPRACEACRALKVRCEPADGGAPCRRCSKAGRVCVVTEPTRKRQKKTDSRVAELERRIDALTASLVMGGPAGDLAGQPAPQATVVTTMATTTATNTTTDLDKSAIMTGSAFLHHQTQQQHQQQHRDDGPVTWITAKTPPSRLASLTPGSASNLALASPPPPSHPSSPLPPPPHPPHHHFPSPAAATAVPAAAPATLPQPPPPHRHWADAAMASSPPPPPLSTAGHKRKHSDVANSTVSTASAAAANSLSSSPPARPVSRYRTRHHDAPQPPPPSFDPNDPVARGLITLAQATVYLRRYTQDLVHHMPAVILPAGVTVPDLRRDRPTLFRAVMAAAAGENVELQRILVTDLMRQVAEAVVVRGRKSLELIESLLLASLWYYPPDNFEELKFYQMVHMAAVMAIDLGLGRRKRSTAGIPSNPNPSGSAKNGGGSSSGSSGRRSAPVDPTSVKARRLWLACYYMATNTAMALHRPNLIRWTGFMAECVEILTTSPDAAPTDPYLCHLVWTHRLAEDVGVQFMVDDWGRVGAGIGGAAAGGGPGTGAGTGTGTVVMGEGGMRLSERRTQFVLKGLERELENYRAGIPENMIRSVLAVALPILDLYIHETALQSDASATTGAPPSPGPRPGQPCPSAMHGGLVGVSPDAPLTSAHVAAVSACLRAIDRVFDAFHRMSVHEARCLPSFTFVRVTYALVVLIKIYFSAKAPGSEVGRVFGIGLPQGAGGGGGGGGDDDDWADDLGVEAKLRDLLNRFTAIDGRGQCRPAGKFLVILMILQTWFMKQKRAYDTQSQPQTQVQIQAQAQAPAPPPPQPPPPSNPVSTGFSAIPPPHPPPPPQLPSTPPIPTATIISRAASASSLHVLSEVAATTTTMDLGVPASTAPPSTSPSPLPVWLKPEPPTMSPLFADRAPRYQPPPPQYGTGPGGDTFMSDVQPSPLGSGDGGGGQFWAATAAAAVSPDMMDFSALLESQGLGLVQELGEGFGFDFTGLESIGMDVGAEQQQGSIGGGGGGGGGGMGGVWGTPVPALWGEGGMRDCM